MSRISVFGGVLTRRAPPLRALRVDANGQKNYGLSREQVVTSQAKAVDALRSRRVKVTLPTLDFVKRGGLDDS